MNRCALITGASGGIGRAAALRLAADGFDIAACWHSDEAGAAVLGEELEKIGVRFRLYQADVADFSQVESIFEDALEYFGNVSVLVNNAGMAQQKLFTDISEDEFDRICAVNFKSIYNCCKFAVPYMVQRKSGKIINISSMWGICGASCETVYSATKAAVIGFTKALGKELAPSNIQVNCIAPGAIDTKMNSILSDEDKAAFAEEIPAGRFGTPEEIAGIISFLAGNDSSYITAQVITADGGLT